MILSTFWQEAVGPGNTVRNIVIKSQWEDFCLLLKLHQKWSRHTKTSFFRRKGLVKQLKIRDGQFQNGKYAKFLLPQIIVFTFRVG